MSLRVRRSLFVVLAAFLVTVACPKDEPFVPVATTITVSPTTRAFTALTQTQLFTAAVLDQQGNAMTAAVAWTSSSITVATVNDTGRVTAQSVGTATISARIGTVSGSASVTVTQVPFALNKVEGDSQSAPVGNQLAVPIVARVTDAAGLPINGVTVSFAVTAGGGSVALPSATTNGLGRAGTAWTMGPNTGQQRVTVSSAGVTSPLPFAATALAAPPDTVIKHTADGQSVPAGTAVSPRPAVLVRDQFGNPTSGTGVTFAVTQGGGQVTGASQVTNSSGIATVGSWVVGASGAQELTATVTGSSIGGNPITFAVTVLPPGTPDSIRVADGNDQTGLAGSPLNLPPAAQVLDALNNPVQGATVTFAVTGGGGIVTGETATTNLQGIARVGSWTINLGANTMTASVAGVATPATFTATGVNSAFAITVHHVVTPSPTMRAVFDSAAARWARVIIGDLADVPITLPQNTCGVPGLGDTTMTIDDLFIYAILEPIDGPGQILGQAGYCGRRPGGLPFVGLMRFDTDDLAFMESEGVLEDVILHEMAHVLGLNGTLWQAFGLLANAGGADPFFTGAQARTQFDSVGGVDYTAGGKVPVENTGGPGTAGSHWRESVFDNELMTGFVNTGVGNPLSRVTAAQFGDLGFTVNLAEADAYTLPTMAALRAAVRPEIHLENDIYRGPVIIVDAAGRILRVIQPQ